MFLTLGDLLSLSGVEENISGGVLTEPSLRWLLKCACALCRHLSPACTLLTDPAESCARTVAVHVSERSAAATLFLSLVCTLQDSSQFYCLWHVASILYHLRACKQQSRCLSAQRLGWRPLKKYWSWSRLWLFSFADHVAGLMSRPWLLQNVGTHSAIL